MHEYKKTTFKNGLRVITVPFKNTETVTALILVGTGSQYEKKELSGISHYLEHLVFKGSRKYPNALRIATSLDELGAQFNAFTTDEVTGFYVKVVKDKIAVALDVMGDFLKNPLFASSEIERERGVILEELNMYRDMPSRHVHELFQKVLWGDQPAGRPVGGAEDSVRNIKRSDILKYFSSHYRNENIVVVFAGNLSHTRGLKLAKKYFGSLPAGSTEEKRPVTKFSVGSPLISIEHRKSDQTHIILGVPGFDLSDERRYALFVAGAILGGGMSSRLFTEVREKRGLAYSIGAGSDSGTDYGEFMISGGITNSKLQAALRIIIGELSKIKKIAVPKRELAKAKSSIEGHMFIGLESSDAVAAFWGEQEILTRSVVTPIEHMQHIMGVSAKDVQEVVNDVFLKSEMRLAIIGPHRDKEKLKKILLKV